jgi:HAD superfamily hydrolase (TIGR01450 family)
MTWVLDLDGVVWRGDEPIAGAAEAVARLRHRGERVALVTNNSSMTVSQCQEKLQRHGLLTAAEDVITSAQAAARLVEPGSTVLVCAGPGVDEALEARQVLTVREGRADAVVVGWHREFDYERLRVAMNAVRGGARLIGTNDDATYPISGGLWPGGGAILAAVAYASGVVPIVAGKPNDAIVALVGERLGPVEVMVGDRASTDGLLARRLGARFALVLSGVTSADQLPVEPEPDEIAPDLAALVP